MSDSTTRGLTISFECPVCEQPVKMEATQQHYLTLGDDPHTPTFTGSSRTDDGCPVYFRKDEQAIRRDYEFIRYEMPTIFTQVSEFETDHDIFRALLDSTVTHRLGVTLEVTKQNQDGERTGKGLVHGWYHDNKPSYYGVVRGIRTPQNVIVTESRTEFADFLERWYYYNREYEKPDTEYRDFKPSPENASLEDF